MGTTTAKKMKAATRSWTFQRSTFVIFVIAIISIHSLLLSMNLSITSSPWLESSSIAKNPQSETGKSSHEKSRIVKFTDKLVQAPQTIVTAYFRVKSKHPAGTYDTWMKNMLSLQDPMVIFLSPALIPQIKELRSHAWDRTVIIPMEVTDLPIANAYSTQFWEHQFSIDPEQKIHKGYMVFWIWLSKSWWVTEAVRHNFFHSDVFVWSDMGCFRRDTYNGKEVVQHYQDIIPRHSILFLAHREPNPPPTKIWNAKLVERQHFYTSGSLFAGYGDTWIKFHQYFMDAIQKFLEKDMFIGEDQTILQSTCLLHPNICAYIRSGLVKDDRYFGLRYALFHGGQYELWYPPALE